jgi:uncharacterized FAD-dependent dehydrogenase
MNLCALVAPEDILWAAHPHIGTFKLVKVVEGLRTEIIRLGGEVRFAQRVTDICYDRSTPTARPAYFETRHGRNL